MHSQVALSDTTSSSPLKDCSSPNHKQPPLITNQRDKSLAKRDSRIMIINQFREWPQLHPQTLQFCISLNQFRKNLLISSVNTKI